LKILLAMHREWWIEQVEDGGQGDYEWKGNQEMRLEWGFGGKLRHTVG
jgi:hypothetical protein